MKLNFKKVKIKTKKLFAIYAIEMEQNIQTAHILNFKHATKAL